MFLALAIPAVIFAGISKGGFGAGAAFAATPILALVVEPAVALGLMLPLLMLMDVAAMRVYWRRWDWRCAKVLVLACLPGVALGAALYRLADPDLFRLLIGLMAVGFVAFQMLRRSGILRLPPTTFSPVKGSLAGFAAGFTSFVSHAGGPPVAMFLLPLGLSKTAFQATTVVFFWVLNAVKVVPYAFLGFFTLETLIGNVVLAPFAFLGVWLGVRAHLLVPERLFFAITYVLLTVTGGRLIWVALT